MFHVKHPTGLTPCRKKGKIKVKDKIETIINCIILAVIIIAVVACVALWLYAQIAYANTPIKDLPMWVYMFIK